MWGFPSPQMEMRNSEMAYYTVVSKAVRSVAKAAAGSYCSKITTTSQKLC